MSRFRPRGDLFHTNTLEVLDGSLAHRSPIFARGNILTAFNQLSVVAILDPQARRLVWAMAGPWQGVHYPTLLADGRILLFANGARRGASTVAILDPLDSEYDWIYRGDPPESLYSEACGSAQQLPNGNVLIAESADGRILEVTPEREIVWEYLNPFDMPDASGDIPLIYFATRHQTLPGGLRAPG